MSEALEGGRRLKSTPPVHILVHGFPLCGFSTDTPNKWPDHGKWVGRDGKKDATCIECIQQELALVNESHPELQQGEIWFMNISQVPNQPSVEIDGKSYEPQVEFIPEWHDDYMKLQCTSKRVGKVGYDYMGIPNGSFPVFISKEEFDEKIQLNKYSKIIRRRFPFVL